MKVGVVGGGNMGLAYARSLVNKNVIEPEDLFIYESFPERILFLKNLEMGRVLPELDDEIKNLDVLILAVKPQSFIELSESLRDYLSADTIVISIMAGVKTAVIRENLKAFKVVRAMPNTPCQNGLGATGYLLFDPITSEEKELVNLVLNSTGICVEVTDEDAIDSVTALSGSGPAYVFAFTKAMSESGISMGLDPEDAQKLAIQTIKGAVNLMETSGKTFQELIEAVKSKGGTTEAALNNFEKRELGNVVDESLKSAKNRAKELSDLIH